MVNKLPANWKLKTLSEVGNIILGGTPDTTKKEYWNGNILWVIPSEVTSLPSKYLYDTERKITELGLKNSSAKIIKPNSLIICTRATIGNCCINKNEVATNQGFKSIIPNEDYDVVFLYYLIINNKQKLISKASGTTFLEISKTNLANLSFYFPPLYEQKRIASALSKIDEYLENTIKLIEEKERFKRGIAKKLLTCKEGENIPEARFKGFEDEWEIVKLGDIGTITATGVDKKINDNETPIKLLNYLDVFNRNKLYEKEISYMTTATEKQLEKCNIRKGDLFITPSSEDKKGIAKSSVAMEDFKNTVYSYHIIRVRFNREIDLKFKSYMCDTDFFHRQAYRLCDGSGQRYFIKLDNFRNMEICIPKSIKEQEKIGGYLSLLDAEIDNLKKQKELIKEMKRGAMQKLLSGEVRLLE